MTSLIDMRRLRLQLVEDDRALRTLKDNFEAITAEIAKEAFEIGKVSGKNAEERERNLTVYLESHEDYRTARSMLRDAEWQRDRTTALLEAAKDERRAAEWQIRAKLAAMLDRNGVQSDADDPASDVAFDDTGDAWIDFMETNGR